MSTIVTLVPTEEVPFIWEAAAPHIEKSLSRTGGRYEISDALEMLLFTETHLWVAFEEDTKEVKGAVMTYFADYPQKKYLHMLFCGGVDGFSWKDEMLATLKDWAYDNKCDGIESNGRAGWAKIFESDGYKKLWQCYELPMEEY